MKGGLPSKRAVVKSLRNTHESHIGNISSHSTSEYANVGLEQHTCLTANISNQYGTFGNAHPDKPSYGALNIDEALVPFVNQMFSDRLFLA